MKLKLGHVALVTGASRGLGVHIAGALARKGCDLALTARSEEALAETAGRIAAETGRTVETVVADMSNPDAARLIAERVEARFGRIDVLVNNAGIESTRRYDRHEPSDIEEMVAVNLRAPMLLTRHVLPGMIARRRGHVVNVASVGGLIAAAYEECYNATKFGLIGFTRSLRLSSRECRWGIGASSVCPGFTTGTGIYEAMRRDYGAEAPSLTGTNSAEAVGQAVVRAIERNLPDVVLMRGGQRLNAALSTVFPRTFEHILRWSDAAAPFRTVAAKRDPTPPPS